MGSNLNELASFITKWLNLAYISCLYGSDQVGIASVKVFTFTVNSNNSERTATLCVSVLFTERNCEDRVSVGLNTWPTLSQVKVSPPRWRLKYPSPGPTVAPACQLEPPDLSNAARPRVPSLSNSQKWMNGETRTPWSPVRLTYNVNTDLILDSIQILYDQTRKQV